MKDSSADAGDTGWIPSPGKPVTTTEPVLSSPGAATGEVSAVRRVHTTTREEPLLAMTTEEPTQQGRHGTAQNKQVKKFFFKFYFII